MLDAAMTDRAAVLNKAVDELYWRSTAGTGAVAFVGTTRPTVLLEGVCTKPPRVPASCFAFKPMSDGTESTGTEGAFQLVSDAGECTKAPRVPAFSLALRPMSDGTESTGTDGAFESVLGIGVNTKLPSVPSSCFAFSPMIIEAEGARIDWARCAVGELKASAEAASK